MYTNRDYKKAKKKLEEYQRIKEVDYLWDQPYLNQEAGDVKKEIINLIESERLNLDIEVYSEECGMCFQEHYVILKGDLVCDECVDWCEYYLCDYENARIYLNEALKIEKKNEDYINEEAAWNGSIYDLSKLLEQEGIYVRETYDTIVDAKTGEKEIKVNVTDVISSSTTLIYICIIILSSLALFIVYIMYLRDRHNEWCLYCSIGYSRKEIYSLVMRELLFVFGIALVIGIGLAAAAVVAIDFFMLTPQGMKCKYFYPDAIVEILCAYVLLVGALQIPIRYALHRIRTIDAMDDDLY